MKTYELKVKALIGTFAVVLSLNGCNKNEEVTASLEEAVLLQSPFHPGEQSPGADEALPTEGSGAPRVLAAAVPGGDGGFIAGPGASPSGGDGGTIAAPGTTSGGSSTSTSTSGTPDPTSSSSSSTSSTGSTATSDPNTSTSSGTSSGTDSGSSSTTSSSTSGSDGGSISSPTGSTTGSDGGVIPGGGTTAGNDTGSASGTSSSGGTSTGGTSDPTGGTSSSTSGTGSSTTGSSFPTGNDGGSMPSTGGTSAGGDTGSGSSSNSGSGGSDMASNSGSQNGNNGVGNGVDPQPPGNPPVNDGPGTSPGNPGNQGGTASNGGNGHDQGGQCTNTNTPGDDGDDDHFCSCKCVSHQKKCRDYQRKMKVVLSRVCSVSRSATKKLFFEEAQHRILTLEATVPKMMEHKFYAKRKGRDARFAAIGYASLPQRRVNNISYPSIKDSNKVRFLVAHFDLSEVDLFKGKYSMTIDWSFKKMREEFGALWGLTKVNVLVCEDSNQNGFCGDEQSPNLLSMQSPSFSARFAPRTLIVDVWHGRYKRRVSDPELCEKQYSPIVMDLTGAGIQLIGPESGVRFDLNATGSPLWTGWVNSRTAGFLVRDLNDSGVIESGSELFGNATVLSNGVRAVNGFEAMKDLDSNLDGKLNRDDTHWSELMVWVDRNADAETDRGELYSLSRLQVESFNLNYVQMMEVDNFGNQTRQRSTYTRRIRGQLTPLQVIDVWFNTLGE